MKFITLDKLIKDLSLEIIYKSTDLEEVKITKSDVNRPGLQMAGYFENFPYERVQIIGNVECSFLNTLSKELRYKRMEEILSFSIPCIVISTDLSIFTEILELAKQYNKTILRTSVPTTKFISKLIGYLDYSLAPETSVHGVLVEVYGMGVLITGKSGVGKSETALELVKRGHRLVADDSIKIKRVEEELRGQAPDLIRHFMEIRGLGIIDIQRLYGVGAIKKSEFIDLVVELEFWDKSKEYDRLGLDEEYLELLGIKIPIVTIPVRPGRNIAMIVEVAARNTRQKRLGYNAAKELDSRIKSEIEKNRKNEF